MVPYSIHEYFTNRTVKSQAIIMNVQRFKKPGLNFRNGSIIDVEKIDKSMRNELFEKTIKSDPTRSQIMRYITKVTKKAQGPCIMIYIASHGGVKGKIWAADDFFYMNEIFDLLSPTKAPKLDGKPKYVLVNACRGTKVDEGYYRRESGEWVSNYSDICVYYSTFDGFKAFKTPENGSYFADAFCKQLDLAHASMLTRMKVRISSIFLNTTRVLSIVRYGYTKKEDIDKKKHQTMQIPTTLSTLGGLFSLPLAEESKD